MNRRSILSVSATIALFGITAGSTARAAEIKLLCAVALQPGMVALIPDFEKSSGHKVAITYGTAGAVADRVQKGEAADIVISSVPLIDQLQAQGKVMAGSRVNITKVGVGVFVRKGAAKPDISSADGFNARCWPQDRLLILIRPVEVPAASTWPACSNDWASLRK